MFQCFLKVMRINTLTILKVKNLSFSGLENLQKTASCMIFIASLETARFRLKKLQLRATSDESWSDDPVLPAKNLSQDTGTTKSSGVRSEDPFKKFTKNNLSHKKKQWPLLSFESWLVSRNPYFMVYFKNAPHNWGFSISSPKNPKQPGVSDHLGSWNVNPEFLGLGFKRAHVFTKDFCVGWVEDNRRWCLKVLIQWHIAVCNMMYIQFVDLH